jgi:hypothetical protein
MLHLITGSEIVHVVGAMNLLLVHHISFGFNRGSHCLFSSFYDQLKVGTDVEAEATD